MSEKPSWVELFDAIQHAVFEELPTFGRRRSLGGGARLVPTGELPGHEPELLDLLLLLLYWRERFSGEVPWNYDDLQSLAEELDDHAAEWSATRPNTSSAMRAFTQEAWTVL